MATSLFHRGVRLICLAGAAPAPLLTALISREFARYAGKHVLPKSNVETLPALTEAWIAKVADGSLPLPLIGLVMFFGMAAAGGYSIFSKRLTAEASGSLLAVICCFGWCSALTIAVNTTFAIVLPFLSKGAE